MPSSFAHSASGRSRARSRRHLAWSAGVALAAGTTAQLVVDAPALVPLAADDKEPARPDHFLVRRADLLADGGGPRLALRRIGDQGQIGLEPHLEVAAELNVGAAAGH